jgi:hypothetical protein
MVHATRGAASSCTSILLFIEVQHHAVQHSPTTPFSCCCAALWSAAGVDVPCVNGQQQFTSYA